MDYHFPTASNLCYLIKEDEVLLIMKKRGLGEGKWNGPYLKRSDLLDLWDNPYIYIAEGEYNPGSFDLVSLGADAMDGGEGDNADIIND